jgi:hypothetical protein
MFAKLIDEQQNEDYEKKIPNKNSNLSCTLSKRPKVFVQMDG